MTSIDSSRFVYQPGQSDVVDIDLDQHVIHDQSGRRVTEAVLDDEAADLARRYPGLVPGGKSLSGDSSHSPTLRLVVSRETRERVVAAAEADHMSVSRWLRRVVEERLAA